jgi:hypothetical protein
VSPGPRDVHRNATRILSVAMIVLGVAMIATTVTRGGGPLALGLVLGLMFVAAGIGRLLFSGRAG